MVAAAENPLQCSTLRRACVTLNKAQPTCSGRCSERPFRIDVYGPHAKRDVNATVVLLRFLKDPLNAFQLRHLERDLFVAPPGGKPPLVLSSEPAHMLWPEWESGFSEVLMWTLLPLGYIAHTGTLPNTTWMISGALVTRSWEPLARMSRGGMCTVERDVQVEDMLVSNPLPRCPSLTCHSRLNLCRVISHVITHEKSYQGRMALDAALGFPTPSLLHPRPHRPRTGSASSTTRGGELTILFAQRHSWHGRHILNQQELIDSCSSTHAKRVPDGWRLNCKAVSLGRGSLVETVRLMRSADVLVGMHGGELMNAMHMLPGRSLFEVVNHGFHLAGDGWLNHYWLHTSPVLHHVRIVLPPPPLLSGGGQQQSSSDDGEITPEITPLHIAWNANASLPLDLFWQAFNETVLAAASSSSQQQQPKRPTTMCPLHSRCFGYYRDVGNQSTARLGPPLPHPAVATWLTTHSKTGFCGKTKYLGDNACEASNATSGAWRLSNRAQNGPLRAAAEHCLRLCSSCARCAYISFSQRYGDCSWFTASACILTSLSNEIKGFTSGRRYVVSAAETPAAATTTPSSSSSSAATTALTLKPSSRFSSMAERMEFARQSFLSGKGALWLQHVRKAGGTSLCRALSDAVHATLQSVHDQQQQRLCTTLHPEQRSFEAAMRAWDMGARLWESEIGGFPTLARRGMVDDRLSEWVFVTCLRDPISLLISSALYDVDYHLLVRGPKAGAKRNASAAAGVVNVSALSTTLLQIASGQSREQILHGCRYDNYMTRIFSSSCLDDAAMGPHDMEEALMTLAGFEIVFVLEWLPEMLPLARYRLGLDVASVGHRNRNSDFQPFKYQYNTAKLRRQQLATRKASDSDELRAQLPPATLARLKELLRFDYALYDEAKRRARAAAAKELPLYTQDREDVR